MRLRSPGSPGAIVQGVTYRREGNSGQASAQVATPDGRTFTVTNGEVRPNDKR